MPTYKASSLEVARSSAKAVGMIMVSQQASIPIAVTTNDIIRFGPFPAGLKPSHVEFVHGELDTGTDALRAKVGYSHADGSAGGDDDLFGSALTTFNAASGAGGSDLIASVPVEIQKDFYIDIVPTTGANAMATAKTIHCVLFGEGVGAK
jgi:hypothetical protein